RLLPFWYLLLLLLAMLGAAELIRGAGTLLARVSHPFWEPLLPAPERVPVPAASGATREAPAATVPPDDDRQDPDRGRHPHRSIASMAGLYSGSSATTPYHFLSVSALSAPGNASNPQRNLPYRTLAEFDVGVKYMQTLGVRYYMVFSDQAKALADQSSQLVPVATTPDTDGQPPLGWKIYEVRDAPVVQALGEQPVVGPGVSAR